VVETLLVQSTGVGKQVASSGMCPVFAYRAARGQSSFITVQMSDNFSNQLWGKLRASHAGDQLA
jgi:hypothetical protein